MTKFGVRVLAPWELVGVSNTVAAARVTAIKIRASMLWVSANENAGYHGRHPFGHGGKANWRDRKKRGCLSRFQSRDRRPEHSACQRRLASSLPGRESKRKSRIARGLFGSGAGAR